MTKGRVLLNGEHAPFRVPPRSEPMPEKFEKLLTVEEARKRLALGVTKTYSMITSGELPTLRLGRAIRIRESALNAWMQRRERNGKRHERGA